MLYLKAHKTLECGCVFYAYITDSHYLCRSTYKCDNCSYDKLEKNEDLLCDEFSIHLPFPDEDNYSKLIPLGWTPVEKMAGNAFKFVEDSIE
jgi:hypothetical protein